MAPEDTTVTAEPSSVLTMQQQQQQQQQQGEEQHSAAMVKPSEESAHEGDGDNAAANDQHNTTADTVATSDDELRGGGRQEQNPTSADDAAATAAAATPESPTSPASAQPVKFGAAAGVAEESPPVLPTKLGTLHGGRSVTAAAMAAAKSKSASVLLRAQPRTAQNDSRIRRSSMRKPASAQPPRRVSSSVQFNIMMNDVVHIPSHKKMSRKQKLKQWCTEEDLQNAKEDCLRTVQQMQTRQSNKALQPSQLRGLEMFNEEIAFQKARISMHSVAAVLQEQYNQKQQHSSAFLAKTMQSSSGELNSPGSNGNGGGSSSMTMTGRQASSSTAMNLPIVDENVLSEVYAKRAESSRHSAVGMAMIDRQVIQDYIRNAEEEVRKEHAVIKSTSSSSRRNHATTSNTNSGGAQDQASKCFGIRWRNPFRSR